MDTGENGAAGGGSAENKPVDEFKSGAGANLGITIPGELIPEPERKQEANTPDYETLARKDGWKPKEEFDGDPEAWVDSKEFVKRKPLFDKIKIQSTRLKDLEKTVEAMAKHYSISVAQAKEKAINELMAERREAIELGEANKVEQIDKRIDEVKATPEPEIKKTGYPPEVEAFISEQKDWWNVDQEMTDMATAYNIAYLKKHPGQLDESLKETLKMIKKAFPEKFVNKRRNDPPPVDGGGQSQSQEGKYSMSRLSPEQKLVYNQLVKTHKQMTHDEYFKDLDEAGFLEK
jgi:hypothetical protein